MERKLITLYKTRTFGQKMSDTFDFVTENWKPLLKFSTYFDSQLDRHFLAKQVTKYFRYQPK